MNVTEFIDLAEALRSRFGRDPIELPDPHHSDSPAYDFHPRGDDGDSDGDGADGGGDGGGDG
jgi:hypothetical protein